MNAVAADRIVVRAVESGEELRLAHDLMARVHVPDYSTSMIWLESSALAYPGLRREHTRIAVSRGTIAGALRLTTDTIRLGEARLKMGGLGWVTTAPDYRHRGVSTALIEDTLSYMRGHGYHVSMLFGIPNFYHRFGYATTLADYSVSLDVDELPKNISERLRERPVKPGDIPAIQRIHSRNDTDVACSLIRSSAHYSAKWQQFSGARVLVDQRGKLVAFGLARESEGRLEITDVGIASADIGPDLLAHCARVARDRMLSRVRFTVPPEHPLAHVLATFESSHEMRLSRERGGMMTFVDVAEALECLIPEWEAGLLRNGHSDLRAELTLIADGNPFRIQAHRGAVSVRPGVGRNKFSISRVDLMRLATGYVHVEDILRTEPRLIGAEARLLLASLFPKRSPFVHLFDRF